MGWVGNGTNELTFLGCPGVGFVRWVYRECLDSLKELGWLLFWLRFLRSQVCILLSLDRVSLLSSVSSSFVFRLCRHSNGPSIPHLPVPSGFELSTTTGSSRASSSPLNASSTLLPSLLSYLPLCLSKPITHLPPRVLCTSIASPK